MTTLNFKNKIIPAIKQDNQIWLTATDVGISLGYSNPLQGISLLFNRHADEFTPSMTTLIDMPTNGGMQKVRIFNLRGCHLIGMLSHTKVAKEFRRWVLDILDKETQQPQQLPLSIKAEAETQPDGEMLHIAEGLQKARDMLYKHASQLHYKRSRNYR